MKTITIFGATGRMQHHLVNQALAEGYKVIGYARNPSKMKIQHPNLVLVQGSLDDVSAIEEAIENADVVIETIGAVSKGTQNIIEAMKKANVKRLIVVSTTNVSDEKDVFDLKFYFLMTITKVILRLIGLFNPQISNAVQEVRKAAQLVRASDLDWTLVRVAVLNDKLRSNNVKSGYLGQKIVGLSISRADMASFLLKQVTDKIFIRQAPAISN